MDKSGSTISGKEIFVVDDDDSIANTVSSLLTLEGYSVNTFFTGFHAVKKAKEKPVDLVLLDYFLPGERAEIIINNLRNIHGDRLPIVLMSASVHAEQKAKKLEVNEFIAKPFQIDALLSVVRRNLN